MSLVAAALTITLLFTVIALSVAQPGQWHSITPSDGEAVGVNTHNLNGVHCLNAANCWAVGDESVIVHWDGSIWRRVESPVPGTVNLFDVFMAAANDGWIVGSVDSAGGTYPTVLHWDGTSWIDVIAHLGGTPFAAGLVGDLRSVWFVTPSNGWAVGADGAAGTVDNIIHITGSWPAVTLTIVNPGGSALGGDILNSIHMFSATNGWAVGDGPIIYRTTDGATWSGIPVADIPAGIGNLNAVYMADGGSNVWAVGDLSTIIKYSGVGTTWNDDGTGTLTTTVNYGGIWMLSPTDGWIVGAAEPLPDIATIIQRRSPGIWVLLTPPQRPTDLDLNDVMMVSSSAGWAVGEDGVILRFSGEWHSQTSPTDVNLHAVHMISPSLGWTVGDDGADGGKIFKWNGASWDLYPRPSIVATIQLRSVHFDLTGSVGFIVGTDSFSLAALIWKWNAASSQWVPDATAPVGIGGLNDVFVVSTTDAWAVGDTDPGGTVNIIRWQAGIWTQTETGIPILVDKDLNSVWFTDVNHGFVVGDYDTDTTPNGPILMRWVSTSWFQDNPPPEPGPSGPSLDANLNSVQCLDVNNCWTVGGVETQSSVAAIVRWDGPTNRWWRVSTASIPIDLGLNEIWMVSAGEGWAVGDSAALPDDSMIAYWDAFSWRETEPDPPTLTVNLNSICMLSPTDGWVVGDDGRILRFGPFLVPFVTTYTVTSSVTSTQTLTGTSTTYVATTTISSSTVTTMTSTATQTTTSFTTVTGTLTPQPSPIPGFPVESILIGVLGGLVALTLIRRRRMFQPSTS